MPKVIRNPMETSTSDLNASGETKINTSSKRMTMQEFSNMCKELLRSDVHYVNKDFNINIQDYYHSTHWMTTKLSLINTLCDYVIVPGVKTDDWQNLAIFHASEMFKKTNETCLKSGIINLKEMPILTGPYAKMMNFGTFDSICRAYAGSFVDTLKKMGWIETYISIPTIAPEALGDLENLFKSCVGMIDSMPPEALKFEINAPYWLHFSEY